MELVGWIGSMLLALCGLPQAIKSIRSGTSRGISLLMLLMWFSGEVFGLVYVISLASYPLIFNYFLNLVLLLIILKYWFYPRNKEGHNNV